MLLEQRFEIRRLIIFTVVGTVNTVVCYLIYAALVEWFDWGYVPALVADYGFGAVLGYVLHRAVTFADRKHLRQAFSKYTLSLVVTFLLNLVLLDWIIRADLLDPLAAQAVAQLAVTLIGYVIQRNWVFRSVIGPTGPASRHAGAIADNQVSNQQVANN